MNVFFPEDIHFNASKKDLIIEFLGDIGEYSEEYEAYSISQGFHKIEDISIEKLIDFSFRLDVKIEIENGKISFI